MRMMSRPPFVALSICVLALLGSPGRAVEENSPDPGPSYYLIGNSLTWDTVPSKLDGDVQWHVDCGKSLPYMYENPEKPCVKTSTLWPTALEKKQYDFLSLQVHYGSTLEEDAAVISTLLDMQPNAVLIVHTGWARSESRVEEYAKTDASGKMQHSPAYFSALFEKLRKFYPDREIRCTRSREGARRSPE